MLRLKPFSIGLLVAVAAVNDPMSEVMLLAGAVPPTQFAPELNWVPVFPQTIVVACAIIGVSAKITTAHRQISGRKAGSSFPEMNFIPVSFPVLTRFRMADLIFSFRDSQIEEDATF